MPTKLGGPATSLRNATLGILLSLSSIFFLICCFCSVCFLALSSSSWTRLDCSQEHLPPFSLFHLSQALQLLPRWGAHRQLGIKDWGLTYSYSCIRFQVMGHSSRYFSVFMSKWLCPLCSFVTLITLEITCPLMIFPIQLYGPWGHSRSPRCSLFTDTSLVPNAFP